MATISEPALFAQDKPKPVYPLIATTEYAVGAFRIALRTDTQTLARLSPAITASMGDAPAFTVERRWVNEAGCSACLSASPISLARRWSSVRPACRWCSWRDADRQLPSMDRLERDAYTIAVGTAATTVTLTPR